MKMSLELEISFMVEYAIRDGKEMANVKLRDFKSNQEGIKYGIVGDESLYDKNGIREAVSKVIYIRNMPLYLFVEDESGQRKHFEIDISKDWPSELTEDKNIFAPGKVTIKL
jgi:hypothetical protein